MYIKLGLEVSSPCCLRGTYYPNYSTFILFEGAVVIDNPVQHIYESRTLKGLLDSWGNKRVWY